MKKAVFIGCGLGVVCIVAGAVMMTHKGIKTALSHRMDILTEKVDKIAEHVRLKK